MRAINDAGLALIKKYEGCRLDAYQDGGGVWTIGVGHTGPEVKRGLTITQAQADELLRHDAASAAHAVETLVKVPLNDNQFGALGCFVFNVGPAAFASSTLLRLLNDGRYGEVPMQLARWCHDNGKVVPGLIRRRGAEADLWNTLPSAAHPEPTNPAGGAAPALL